MQKENMETKKLMETAFECGLFSQEDVSNPYRGLLQVEQALNVSKKLIVQGSDAGGTAGFSGMVINVAVELAVRSIVYAESIGRKSIGDLIMDYRASCASPVIALGTAAVEIPNPTTPIKEVVAGEKEVTAEASYGEKFGYAAPDTIVKTLINFSFDETWGCEKIDSTKLAEAVKIHALDKDVVYNDKTGAITNSVLPKAFLPSNYKKDASGKLVLKLRGYKNDDETKNFGTDKVMVKVFDATVLNKMKDKVKTVASFDNMELSVAELIEQSSFYLLGQDKGPKVVLAIFEKEL